MKVVRKIALSFMLIGIVLSITAFALGATPNASFASGGETFTKEYTDVTSLDFKINAGVVNIVPGDKFQITVKDFPKDSIVSKLETDPKTGKNRWIIDEKEGFRLQIGIHFEGDSQSVTIELPKDFVANEFNLKLGAGVFSAETIQAKNSNISIGAGTFTVQNLISAKSRMDCGAGEIKINGNMSGENVVECGMGNVELNLIGNPDDYSCTAEVGMGQIVINGDEYGGIANEVKLGSLSATNSFKLECGMGNVNLQISPEGGTENESEKTF